MKKKCFLILETSNQPKRRREGCRVLHSGGFVLKGFMCSEELEDYTSLLTALRGSGNKLRVLGTSDLNLN